MIVMSFGNTIIFEGYTIFKYLASETALGYIGLLEWYQAHDAI